MDTQGNGEEKTHPEHGNYKKLKVSKYPLVERDRTFRLSGRPARHHR